MILSLWVELVLSFLFVKLLLYVSYLFILRCSSCLLCSSSCCLVCSFCVFILFLLSSLWVVFCLPTFSVSGYLIPDYLHLAFNLSEVYFLSSHDVVFSCVPHFHFPYYLLYILSQPSFVPCCVVHEAVRHILSGLWCLSSLNFFFIWFIFWTIGIENLLSIWLY